MLTAGTSCGFDSVADDLHMSAHIMQFMFRQYVAQCANLQLNSITRRLMWSLAQIILTALTAKSQVRLSWS